MTVSGSNTFDGAAFLAKVKARVRSCMKSDAIKKALLESYARDGGINHLDGVNLPSQDRVAEIARDLMHVLFPGYFEQSRLGQEDVPVWLDGLLAKLNQSLATE